MGNWPSRRRRGPEGISTAMHRLLRTALLVLLTLGAGSMLPGSESWPIVVRRGVSLYEGEIPFRFFGLAAANIHQHESQLRADFSNRFPDEYETCDLLETMHRLGARATRSFSLSVSTATDGGVPGYLMGRRIYNEEAFRCLDRVLALCHKYDVRVIIPLIASQSFPNVRGVDEFAAWSGKTAPGAFWIDPEVKADFRALIDFLANRRNTVSGILYRDDPAILAWQLGNEFDSYAPDRKLPAGLWKQAITGWSLEMAAYLKQVDPRHLVMEAGGDREAMLASPAIDVMSVHLYEYWNRLGGGETDLATCLRKELAVCAGRKPLIVDEFGLATLDNVRNLMEAIRRSDVVGGLIWGLRVHRRDGGFYFHNEGGTKVNSYHYPGFAAGEAYQEKGVFQLMHVEGPAISGRPAPAPAPPTPAPVLFATARGLTWRGSTGAEFYQLQSGDTESGPWATVGEKLADSLPLDVAAYEASGDSIPLTLWTARASGGHVRYYRIRGGNKTGWTEYSHPLRVGGP